MHRISGNGVRVKTRTAFAAAPSRENSEDQSVHGHVQTRTLAKGEAAGPEIMCRNDIPRLDPQECQYATLRSFQ